MSERTLAQVPVGFQPLPEVAHAMGSCTMPLVVCVDGDYKHIGTGFAISPNGLLLTAAHVIKAAQRLAGRENWELYALYRSNEPHPDNPATCVGGLINVLYFSTTDATDIAVCCLNMPTRVATGERLTTPSVPLMLAPPKTGDKVIAVGYYEASISVRAYGDAAGESFLDYDHRSTCTSGEVTEVYPIRRDDGLLKWPCFETSAETRPGLSGGPVFHQSGAVCGVLCSQTPSPIDAGKYSFYASMVWPSLLLPVRLINGDGHEEEFRLRDLGRTGLLKVIGDLDGLTIEAPPGGPIKITLAVPKKGSS